LYSFTRRDSGDQFGCAKELGEDFFGCRADAIGLAGARWGGLNKIGGIPMMRTKPRLFRPKMPRLKQKGDE